MLFPGENGGPAARAPPPTPIARATSQTPVMPTAAVRPTPAMGVPVMVPPSASRPNLRPPPPSADDGIDGATVRRASSSELAVVLPKPTDEERAALAEPCELGADERVRILAMARQVTERDPYAVLGVAPNSDEKSLKRAYFKLSKEIHPDRYYGKQLGSFSERLTSVFESVSRAYAFLTTPEKSRKGASGSFQAMSTEQPQTPQEYAAELFARACSVEVAGNALEAMKLFAAAVRIDPQTRYLRRATSCALAAGQPKTAVEYAKKAQNQAPADPSVARLLAASFRALGKLEDAEEILVMAMALKSENDVLTAELRHDLADLRRLLSG